MSVPKQRKVALINVKLPSYAGKALRAGDPFQATARDAKALVAVRMATYATRDIASKPRTPPKPLAPAPDAAELVALRGEYEALAGKKALGFWKADQVRAQIDKLKADANAAKPAADPDAGTNTSTEPDSDATDA